MGLSEFSMLAEQRKGGRYVKIMDKSGTTYRCIGLLDLLNVFRAVEVASAPAPYTAEDFGGHGGYLAELRNDLGDRNNHMEGSY